jgi:ribonuclease-3
LLKYFQITRYKNSSEKKLAQSIKNLFGFYPKNISLFQQALTHSSAAKHSKSNERLEFLGDSILGTIVAEYLFGILPNKDEGVLTQVRSRMVSRVQLNKLAVKLGIDKILHTDIKGNISYTLYGDAFEALVGAICLDVGYEKTKKILFEKIIKQHFDINTLINEDTDYKSRLINFCQKNKTPLQFVLLAENMDGVKKMYHIGVEYNGEIISEAQNASKRVAEQLAASAAIEKLDIH